MLKIGTKMRFANNASFIPLTYSFKHSPDVFKGQEFVVWDIYKSETSDRIIYDLRHYKDNSQIHYLCDDLKLNGSWEIVEDYPNKYLIFDRSGEWLEIVWGHSVEDVRERILQGKVALSFDAGENFSIAQVLEEITVE